MILFTLNDALIISQDQIKGLQIIDLEEHVPQLRDYRPYHVLKCVKQSDLLIASFQEQVIIINEATKSIDFTYKFPKLAVLLDFEQAQK